MKQKDRKNRHLHKKGMTILFLLFFSMTLFSQNATVYIEQDYEILYCSVNNGIPQETQEISFNIKGPKNRSWFVSYSVNNSPAVVANSKQAIELADYNLKLLLKNTSSAIQFYTIKLKEAWFEDNHEAIEIPQELNSATIQVLPLSMPEIEDYPSHAKTNSTQQYSAIIGKNSSYQIEIPEGVTILNNESSIVDKKQKIKFQIRWHDQEESVLFKLIETDAYGCNSDTIYAGVELVESFSVDLGEDKIICEGESATLQPEIDLPSNYSYLWSTGETSEEITVTEAGVYNLSVTDKNDNQQVESSIRVSKQEPPTINLEDHLVLEEYESTIDISSDGCTYLWSDGITKGQRSFTSSGEYSVTKTSAAGCSTSKSLKVKFQEDLFNLELPQLIHMCGNEKMNLSPAIDLDQDYQYSWNTGSIEKSIPIEKAGKYTITVTAPDGFQKTATTEVRYHLNPIVDLGPDLVLWDGEQIILDAENSGASYIWNTGETTQSIIVNSGGVFVVEVSDTFGCSNKDTILVEHKKGHRFGVDLGENKNICEGDSALVTITIEGNPAYPLQYNWLEKNHTSPEIYLKTSGIHTVEVTDANGNLETGTFELDLRPVPQLNLGNDMVSYPNQVIVLDAGTPNCLYTWSTGEITQKISVKTEGKYAVKVTNQNNCSAEDEIYVGFLEDYPYVGLPKAFSPNGDGHNDKLFIRGTDVKDISLIIYNRLGQKLFETNNINTGWDGYFKGELQDIDVYIYLMEFTYLDGKKMTKKGNVALLR